MPLNLLAILENWFQSGVTCVKWRSAVSDFYKLTCGVRQGGVLSPYLFALYIDSVIDRARRADGIGCYIRNECFSILLYADDIILLAPSVTALEQLLHICETELDWLDMAINPKKSACMRIGPQYSAICANILSKNGYELKWVNSIRYWGIYLTSANVFKCIYDNAKSSFYRTFNSIFGKVGRFASEEVVLQLTLSKCLPAMFYGLEVCPINKSQIASLEFAVTGALMKVFCTRDKEVVNYCRHMFNFPTACAAIYRRK